MWRSEGGPFLESSCGSAPTPSVTGTPLQPAPAPLPAEPALLPPEVGIINYPYAYYETIGGESLADTHRRFLLASSSDATPLEFHLELVKSQDQFEADIIQKMDELDPLGGWLERGATYLRNAHTATGEEPFAKMVSLRDQLEEGGLIPRHFMN